MTSNFSQLSTDALSPGQLPESVKALLKRAHINRYPKRTTIVDAGTESKSLYLILKGSVSIILREDDEREIVVAYLNPGDFFGEMGLFEPNPQRTAEVRTRDVCEIAEISYDNFHELSKQYPDLSYAVFAQLVRRLKNTTRKMTDLAFIDVSGRIARCLIDLSSQPEAMILPNGRQIRITRQEIGRIVGCSREMVGRVLKTLEDQGMIQTDGKAILIFTHLNELYLILNKYLKWNKSHLKCFALIMLVIILKQTCNLSSASKALPIKCLPQSFYRRMQRFFAGQYFDYRQISQLIFNMFSFDQVQLTLDRTNWKWGKRNINILMLAIVYRGIAIPILWTLLNKRGNSDTKERIALIQRFIAIFGKDRIVNVFADREFIGEQWFTWLIEQDINFCIRVKKTSLSPII